MAQKAAIAVTLVFFHHMLLLCDADQTHQEHVSRYSSAMLPAQWLLPDSPEVLRPSPKGKTLIRSFSRPIHQQLDPLSPRQDLLHILRHDVLDCPQLCLRRLDRV